METFCSLCFITTVFDHKRTAFINITTVPRKLKQFSEISGKTNG